MTKAETAKVPLKTETINLKVYIHCEGCKKKVKKTLNGVDGVDKIVVDSDLGKVTVTGTVDAKTLIRKLEKAGKHAELWSNPQPSVGKGNQLNPAKENKVAKEVKFDIPDGGSKGTNDQSASASGGNGNGSSGGKKGNGGKKGGGGGVEGTGGGGGDRGQVASGEGGGGGRHEQAGGGHGQVGSGEGSETISVESSSKPMANRSMAPRPRVTVESGYSLESAEYATHMFSDENANNCSIM